MAERLIVSGQKLSRLRQQAGLTQEQAAVRASLTSARLRQLERHGGSVRTDTLGRLADVYGVDPDEVLAWEGIDGVELLAERKSEGVEPALRGIDIRPAALHLTQRQHQVIERLQGVSPVLADLFEAAVGQQLLEGEGEAWIRLAAHACREILNRLPDHIDLPVVRSRIEYAVRLDEIARHWPEEGEAPAEPAKQGISLVDKLVRDHRSGSSALRERAGEFFQRLESGALGYQGDVAARAQLWIDLQRYFVSVAHIGGPGTPDPDIAEFEKNFDLLERVLASQLRAEGFYETEADLEEFIARHDPTDDDADAVAAMLRGELYRAFFERIQSAKWLSLLKEHGFFKKPPNAIVEGQYIRFPGWPESGYLTRVAADAPQEVAQTIREMSATDNPRVHGDFLDCALAMPPAEAALIARLAGPWLEDQHLLLVPDRAGALLAKLAEGGEVEAAVRLARQLLALRKVSSDREVSFAPKFEVKGRVEDYEYQQVLQTHFPRLVEAAPLEAISVLRDVLRTAAKLARERWESRFDDGLQIERKRIDQHEDYPSIENALITALRDAAENLIREHEEEAEHVFGLLEGAEDLLFRRLELHLLARSEGRHLLLRRRKAMLDKMLFFEYAVQSEYERLLETHFKELSSKDQQTLLAFVESGPEPEYREWVAEQIRRDGGEPGSTELEERWEQWRLGRLAPIKNAIIGEAAEKYAQRAARFGEPRYPDDQALSAEFVGPTSARNADELQQMAVEEILRFLNEWNPGEGWREPTREGQGRELAAAVAEDVEQWAQQAKGFTDVPPIYARHLLQGLDAALRQGKEISSWEPVLELGEFVVAQPSLDVEPNFDDDPDYRPSRRALTHLLFQALARKVVPFEFRERVWRLIDLLAHDPDPTVSQDARNDDPSQLGINSTRSVALHAAVAYGLWCAHHLISENEAPSFELVPELRALLEEKLDLELEPARAVRAAYGQYLPNLLYLDKNWVRDRRREIFPHDPAHRSYWRAAWDAFIRYASFNASVIRLLHGEFRLAIDLLDERSEDRLDNPGERLAEYVLLMYVLDLDDPGDSIVDHFFTHAPASLRVRGISHIGLAMGRGEVAAEKHAHLRQLWQVRLESLEDRDPELREYGWWFSSRYFLDAEGLSLLQRTLKKSGGAVDDVKDVLTAVAELGEAEPRECLAVLELVIRGTESYLLDYARESVRSVLEAVLRSDNEGVRSDAHRLIHELGEIGFHGMQDLLAA